MPAFVIEQTKIEGVGFFKIGKSKAYILDSLKPYIGDPIDFKDTEELTNGHIYRATKEPEHWYYCPDYESYVIPFFSISGITFQNINIVFHNDSLVLFRSDWDKNIEEAVNIKYGEVEPKVNKKFPENYKITWRTDKIICQSQYVNDDALDNAYYVNAYKERFSIFFIEKKSIFDKISDCEIRHLEKRIKALQNNVRDKLDKF